MPSKTKDFYGPQPLATADLGPELAQQPSRLSREEYLAQAEFLLRQGADPAMCDDTGMSGLRIAKRNGDIELSWLQNAYLWPLWAGRVLHEASRRG